MQKILQQTWQKQTEYYRSSSLLDWLSMLFIHIFIAWNGVQFIIFPAHFDYIIDLYSIIQNFNIIYETQYIFIPLYAFCLLTGLLIFVFLKNFMEIEFHLSFHKSKISFKDQFIQTINFSIPSFSHNFFILFVLATAYLVLLILYFLCISFEIHFNLDLSFIGKFTTYYFIFGVLFFNILTIDFILPETMKSKTYSESIENFYAYFKKNKLKFSFYYSFKICCISINMFLLLHFFYHFVPKSFIVLPLSIGVESSLMIIVTLFSGALISMLINAFIVQFLNVFCYCLFSVLFEDY